MTTSNEGSVQAIVPILESSESSTDLWFSMRVPHYQFKIFKSKGAVLTLLWMFCGFFTFLFITESNDGHQALLSVHTTKLQNPLIIFSMCMLLYPVLGWLADVKCGRYFMVKWGLRVTWTVSIIFCVTSVLLDHFQLSSSSKIIVNAVIYVPLTLGLGAVIANILPLCVDQLADASSTEIVSFFNWSAWLWFLEGIFIGVSQSCLCSSLSKQVGLLILPSVLTVAVVTDFFLNHWLVLEAVSYNPIALIWKTLRYAVKNKYPRLQSAYVYWDDRLHSRIDLAKKKYGGPFTAEQVEDVKTFFRITSVLLIISLFVGIFAAAYMSYDTLMFHLHDSVNKNNIVSGMNCGNMRGCFQRFAVYYSGNILLVIVIPILELVFYPFFRRYLQLSILKKVSFGLCFFLLSLTVCTGLEFVGNSRLLHDNVTCPLITLTSDHSTLPLDYKWMMLAFITNILGQFLLISSSFEFLCAQSPHSMKGLLIGMSYSSLGFFTTLGYLLLKLVELIVKKWLSSSHYGCLSWYLLIILAVLSLLLVIFLIALKCYKIRSRSNNEDT